jgi:hypothetical protein
MSPTSLETAKLLSEQPAKAKGPGPTLRPMVQVLGSVRIVDAPGPAPLSRPGGPPAGGAVEVVALLALHPEGLTCQDLLPVVRCGPEDLHIRLSRIRRWLGCTIDGAPRLSRVGHEGRWQLRDVDTDWELFSALVDAGGPLQDLLDALGLVDSVPLTGATRRFGWATGLRATMTERVIDVAHTAAEKARQAGDLETARWAVSVGRLVDLESEMLWVDAVQVEMDAGAAAGRRPPPALLDSSRALTCDTPRA